ncbi:MAG: hypothetical protein ACREJC_15495, partial [Tepidisphaeraceae bacterium]
LFTFAYLEIRAWSLRGVITARLESGSVEPAAEPTLRHYLDSGLLTAHVFERPDDLEIYSRMPEPGKRSRWMFGAGEGEFHVPFYVTREQLTPADDPGAEPLAGGAVITINVGFEASIFGEDAELPQPPARRKPLPETIAAPGPATARSVDDPLRPVMQPWVAVQILDEDLNTLVPPASINGGQAVYLSDPTGQTGVQVLVPPDQAANLLKTRVFYIQVEGGAPGVEYLVGPEPLTFAVMPVKEGQVKVFPPMQDPRPGHDGGVPPRFGTRMGTSGLQLRGGAGRIPVAVFPFRDSHATPNADGMIPFEMRTSVERSNADPNEEKPTRLEVTVINRKSGVAPYGPLEVFPENNRTAYFSVPASAVEGGDFDVAIRCTTSGHYLGLFPHSIKEVASSQSFAINLVKSLTILWLLALLVIIVSVFCSTFVSWPIAIVLTLVILLGRWGVMQLGDATAPGIGNLVVQDLFRSADPNVAKTVSTSVEMLTKMLNAVSTILPDISKFSAVEDIERGVAVPAMNIVQSLRIIIVFGIPLMVVAY